MPNEKRTTAYTGDLRRKTATDAMWAVSLSFLTVAMMS